MQNANKTISELEFVSTLKLLTQAYEEVAVIKMQRVKSSVLSTREFLRELSNVFLDVKASYREEIDNLAKPSPNRFFARKATLTTLNKNGRTIAVLISPHGKLYGDLTKRIFHLFTFKLFAEQLKKESNTDIAIVGKSGKDLFDLQSNGKQYQFFDLPDEGVTMNDLKPIVTTILNYEKVEVYYGKFNNMVNQDAVVSNISGETSLEGGEKGFEHKIKFYFEPSLSRILQFFEGQVFALLFYQTVHESELAKLASRTRAMEEAIGNIERNEAQLISLSRRMKKMNANKKQLESLSGISLWRK